MINLMWRVGDFTITKVVEMEMTAPAGGPESALPECWPEAIQKIPWLIPNFANAQGHLRMSVHALLIEGLGRRIIVDTCIGNDKPRQLEFWNKMSTAFLQDLEGIGWTRESVDGVICTHLHIDHVGWNTLWQDGQWVPTFPKAKYYLGRVEFEYWASEFEGRDMIAGLPAAAGPFLDSRAVFLDSVKPVMDAGLVSLVETDSQIAPGIRLMPTLGHTPGHVSVVVESKGDRAVITGDMMHHPCQIARPEWSFAFDFEPAASERTRLAFFEEFADTPTLIIGTHFAGPTAGRLVRDGTAYWLEV